MDAVSDGKEEEGRDDENTVKGPKQNQFEAGSSF